MLTRVGVGGMVEALKRTLTHRMYEALPGRLAEQGACRVQAALASCLCHPVGLDASYPSKPQEPAWRIKMS